MPNQFENFDTSTLLFGMKQNTLLVAGLLTAAAAFVVNTFIGGLGMIIVAGLVFKYVASPLAEWVLDKIPYKYLTHYFDWVTTMNGLHVTNDSSPVPMEIPGTPARQGEPTRRLTAADPNSF